MSANYHPCDRYSCPEWNQGQCFGGGCSRNPIRERELEDAIITRNDCDNEDERKLTEPTDGDAPDEEKLLVDGPMPEDAVPLFNFFLSVKHTKYGPVFAKDYQRYDGCPVAVSMEGMKLLDYVWGFCKKENGNTADRSVRGERATADRSVRGERATVIE